MPDYHNTISAKLIEQAGFKLEFMSGFAVSASQLSVADTGLIFYGEMIAQGTAIYNSISIPMLGDGDTCFGIAVNVERTVQGYANAGFGCIMLEDQFMPKVRL